MKKGFTFIEVLVTISLLSLLILFVVPNLIKFSKDTKKDLYDTNIKNINTSAREYANDNLDSLSNEVLTIKVGDLVKGGYLDEVINPISDENMNKCEINLTYDNKVKVSFVKNKNDEEYNKRCGEE